MFRANVQPGNSEIFEEKVRKYSLGHMEHQHVPYYFGRPIDGADDFVAVSIWPDMESLRRFAGDSLAAVIPFDDPSVIESSCVQHYEVLT